MQTGLEEKGLLVCKLTLEQCRPKGLQQVTSLKMFPLLQRIKRQEHLLRLPLQAYD